MQRLTTAEFVEKAKARHGKGRYDYSRVEYTRAHDKVTIGCNECGEYFQQAAYSHTTSGKGCPKCGARKRAEERWKSPGAVVADFRKVHGGRYGYEKVHDNYSGSVVKLRIYCPRCEGYFLQSPASHLRGQGCPKCGIRKRASARLRDPNNLIAEFKEVHGEHRYGYSKVADHFKGVSRKVPIWCTVCKDYFYQTPDEHRIGSGCLKCSYRERGEARRKDTEVVIADFIKVHSDLYGYEKVTEDYTHAREVVRIYCRQCKEYFRQTPNTHLRGCGCPKCGVRCQAELKRKDPVLVVLDFRKVHGDLYGYEKVVGDYTNYNAKVRIYCRQCKKHFRQAVNSHLSGNGCPSCSSSSGELRVERWLKRHDVEFVREWADHDCRITRVPLRFDFYLPEKRILVEYDGGQHFKPVDFAGRGEKQAKANFKKIRERDAFKNRWVEKNNYVLIRIRYDENVGNVLDGKLLPLLGQAIRSADVMTKSKKPTQAYSKADIRFLHGLEPVRLRPGLYIPGTDSAGVAHLAKEVLDNAVDEFLDGHVSQVVVSLNTETNTLQIRDNGRGIPIDVHSDTGEPTLTGVFSRLNSGSKFGRGAYTSCVVGLNGIGIKCVTALSEAVQVWTVQEGVTYTQKFARGKVTSEVTEAKRSLKRGTSVAFRPDPEIFSDIRFNPKQIRRWLRDTSFLCSGLKLVYKLNGKKEVFYSKKGLPDLCAKSTTEVDLLHEPLIIQRDDFDIVLVYANVVGSHWRSWVNTSPTPEHGTHVTGVQKAVHGIISGLTDKKLRKEDTLDGLIGFISVRIPSPEFRGQSKVRLENKDVAVRVQEIVENVFRRFIAEKPALAKAVVERATELSKARRKFRSEQRAIKGTRVKSGAKGIMPEKLFECPDVSPESRELFIVEGDSAAGTVVDGRVMLKQKKGKPLHFQEVYSLRGVPMNVAKKGSLEDAVANKEIGGLIKVLGTGVGPSFNVTKARHSRIFIMTDADPDGRHIRSLLLTLFAKFFSQLIEEEMIYVVRNPLFRGITANKCAYGDTVEDVKEQLGTSNCRISRFKGLGEMNAEDLQVCGLDPKTRDVARVYWEDENDRELVLRYMGPDPLVRKEILGVVEK